MAINTEPGPTGIMTAKAGASMDSLKATAAANPFVQTTEAKPTQATATTATPAVDGQGEGITRPPVVVEDGQPQAEVATTNPAVPEKPAPQLKELTPASEDTRRQESEALFHNTMMRDGAKALAKKQKGQKLTSDEAAFYRYHQVYMHSEAQSDLNLTQENLYNDPLGMTFNDAPIYVESVNGKWVATKTSLNRVNGVPKQTFRNGNVFFTCIVEGEPNSVEIPAEVILDSVVLSGQETYLKAFGEGTSRRSVAEARIQSIQNPDAAIPESRTIAEAAVEQGWVTSESMHTHITAALTEGLVDQAGADAMLTLIDGSNIANSKAVGAIVHALDRVTPEQIGLTKLKVQELELKVKKGVATPEEQAHLGQLQEHLKFLKQLPESAQESVELFESLYNGELKASDPAMVDYLIKTGKPDQLFKMIQDSNLNDEEKNKYKSFLENAMKYGAPAIIVLIALIAMRASGEK